MCEEMNTIERQISEGLKRSANATLLFVIYIVINKLTLNISNIKSIKFINLN